MSRGKTDSLLAPAIEEARRSLREGGIPIGCILTRGGMTVGKGHNKRVQNKDPTAHAEIECLRNAGRIGPYNDTVLCSTLMPCYMCAGAIVQFGIKKVLVGESKNFEGARKFMQSHDVEVVELDSMECVQMMQEFILKNPTLWYEDIGKK
jgi:cytosine/creatinine deaminase